MSLIKQGILYAAMLLILLAGCHPVVEEISETEETKIMERQSTSSDEKNEVEVASSVSTEKVTHYDAKTLLQAVSEGDEEYVTEILKDPTYPINETNEKGESPLLIATHQNFVSIAKQLIDRGSDINQQDLISDSPYLYAGAQGKTEILSYMLKKGSPDLDKVNRFGGNALIPAAEKGHLENVKLLLEDGRVEIDHQNNFGYTALIEAVALTDGSEVYQEIVQVLLDYKANKQLRDNQGLTAEQYASRLGYTRISEILAAHS